MKTLNLEQLKKEKLEKYDNINSDTIERTIAATRTHFEAIADLAMSNTIDEETIKIHQEAIDYLTTPETEEFVKIVRLQVAIESMKKLKEKFGKSSDDVLFIGDINEVRKHQNYIKN